MKNITILFVAYLLIFNSCSNEKRKQQEDIANCFTLLKNAEKSSMVIGNIPLGISFETQNTEMDKYLEKLSNDSSTTHVTKHSIINLANKQDYIYYYDYPLSNRKFRSLIVCNYSDEIHLSSVSFSFTGSLQLSSADENELIIELKSYFSKNGFNYAQCMVGDKDNMHTNFYCWTKDNLAIYLQQSITGACLIFSNAPVDKPSDMLTFESKFISHENNTDIVTDNIVKNNPWDGSVYQVNKYLKENLKDPDSYESIDWSKVQENNNGYSVRHKYRAKNSFGDNMISNDVFQLDKSGNIISVVPFQ